MNPVQASNLRVLIRHMETNVRERLNMFIVTNACGTPACAMGHARTLPQFAQAKAMGLQEAAAVYFGLGSSEPDDDHYWGRLFGSWLCEQTRRKRFLLGWVIDRKLVADPTPHQWAAEARKVLAEHGYSMDVTQPVEDGFAAFKAKILAPIPEDVGVPSWPA